MTLEEIQQKIIGLLANEDLDCMLVAIKKRDGDQIALLSQGIGFRMVQGILGLAKNVNENIYRTQKEHTARN